MKLIEILSDDPDVNPDERKAIRQLVTRTPSMRNSVADKRQEQDHAFVGAGSNAYVHKHDNPHSLDYVHRTAAINDACTVYLDYISEHPELHNNPFFPRVHKKIGEGSHITHQIERLVPFYTDAITSNEELMASLCERWFDIKYDTSRSEATILYYIETALYGDVEYIKDKQLLNAINIIRAIQKEHGGEIDLHGENVMWRITGKNPELVITDPLWNSI